MKKEDAFIRSGIVPGDAAVQPLPPAKLSGLNYETTQAGGGLDFLDQLGGVGIGFLGSAGSGLINKWFGGEKDDPGKPKIETADQTIALGDAKANQADVGKSFFRQHWKMLAVGGVVLAGAAYLVSRK